MPSVPIACFVIALVSTITFRVGRLLSLVVFVAPAILAVVLGMVFHIEPIEEPVQFVVLFAVSAIITAFLMGRLARRFRGR